VNNDFGQTNLPGMPILGGFSEARILGNAPASGQPPVLNL
jgi:hypothetical protein